MKNYCFTFFLILQVAGLTLPTLQNQPQDLISGTWRGSSICQDKNSACRDENAIYHATKIDGNNRYKLQMNKMVNGQEVEMGPLDFSYDDAQKTLTAIDNFRGTKHTWSFKLSGKTMHGTLTVGNNQVFRIIDLKKDD